MVQLILQPLPPQQRLVCFGVGMPGIIRGVSGKSSYGHWPDKV